MSIDPNALPTDTTFDDEFNDPNEFATASDFRSEANPGALWAAALQPGVTSFSPNNGELEWYADPAQASSYNGYQSPYSINNGVLTITATQIPNFYTSNGTTYNWESGELSTGPIYKTSNGQQYVDGCFSQTYGYFEVNAAIPAGSGWWPAFWLYADKPTQSQEIDILESFGTTQNQYKTTVHDDQLPQDPHNNNQHFESEAVGVPFDGSFHKYGVDWEPDKITFYKDGTEVAQFETPRGMDVPMHMILNMAVGSIGGTPSASSAAFQIDYVRAYHSTEIEHNVLAADGNYTAENNVVRVNVSGSNHDLTTNSLGDTFYLEDNTAVGQVIHGFTSIDTLDLAGLLTSTGHNYFTEDVQQDGVISFASDGQGNAQVLFDNAGGGAGTPVVVATLMGVDPGALEVAPTVGAAPQYGSAVVRIMGSAPPSEVYVSDASYTAPSGVTAIHLTGTSSQTVTGNNEGDTFYSSNHGNRLIGGTGNDTFYVGRDTDVVTGGGGNDTFIFNDVPWSAYGHITDFNAGDSIDLTPALQKAGYTSGDPVAEGFLKIDGDSSGDARIWFDPQPSGSNQFWLVSTLDGVASDSLAVSGGVIMAREVYVSDASYTAPPGVTAIHLTGTSSQTITGNNEGDTFYSSNHGNRLIGGTGNDTFYVGRDTDVVTGGGGNDTFIFNDVPWSAYGHITDFNAGDAIDLTSALQKAGYTSGDPVAEGFLKIDADSSGDARVWFDPQPSGSNQFWLVSTLDGVAASNLHVQGGLIML